MDDRETDDNPFEGLSRYPPAFDECDEPHGFDSTGEALLEYGLKIVSFGIGLAAATYLVSLPIVLGLFGLYLIAGMATILFPVLLFVLSIARAD